MIHPASWEELEAKLIGDGDENRFTRERALWSGARLDLVERYLGGAGNVHLGPLADPRRGLRHALETKKHRRTGR